ncbi:hypothetical protein E4L96_17765 [Massilia arenosa]|uniref:Lipocalin-like domain-containing protein n=1 Tax=Zemynaea arenosa TaxID=2561931 RepID=A0A4Y9S2S2_9BURK|nr:hypothetical protein [Massilia arenosa]TFW15604.1 hypothetical protein E4L96_17765 [Massilia arenosa]
MNTLLRLLLLLAPLVAFASGGPDPIVGTWQHTLIVQVADGKVVRREQATDGSSMEFRADGTWTLSSPQNQASGTYRRLDRDRIETTITGSDHPRQIGDASVKRAVVQNDSLILTVDYDSEKMKVFPARADGTRPQSMSVTSTFRRAR